MKLTQKEFDRAVHHINSGRTTAEVAYICKISERMVQRIKEAGTWERWPYIVAKATHGYNTPEYKLYLKRRHLPLTPPAKTAVPKSNWVPKRDLEPAPKKSWWRRLLGL
jgi:hypothetical protein